MDGDTAEPEEALETGVPVGMPVSLPLDPALAAVMFDGGYGTEADALLDGAVPDGTMLFDVTPVSKGVDVALDSGYGAEDDSGDVVEVEDVELSILAEVVELG
jgi:hypothetical protein